jgi:oleandomycin transport system ATP-binding protein
LDGVATVLAGRTGATPAADAESGVVRVQVADAAVLPVIIADLGEAGVELSEFALRRASLDEVFLALTGDQGRDEASDDSYDIRELERSSR